MTAPTAEAKTDLLSEGETLAMARREALASLIKTNPKLALSLAAPWKLRNDLPPAIASLLEESIGGRGDFEVFAAVPLPGQTDGVAPISRQVTFRDKTYEAYVYGRRLHQITTANISLHGIAIDKAMAVHEDPARVIEPEEAQAFVATGRVQPEAVCAVSGQSSTILGQQTLVDYGGQILTLCRHDHAAALNRQLVLAEGGPLVAGSFPPPPAPLPGAGSWTQSPKTLLYMRVIFPDDATEPITLDGANATMNQVNAYFVEASYDTTSIISTITPLLRLPQIKLWYGTNGVGELQKDAYAAAKAAGFDFRNYDLDIVHFTPVPGYKFGGLANLGSRGVWLQAGGVGITAHELGHNYGLFHANFWNTVRPPYVPSMPYPPNPNNYPFDPDSLVGHDSVFGPGLDSEYGDSFDIMGSGGGHYNVVAKNRLNWLPAPYIATVTENSTNRLYPMDVPALTVGRFYALNVRKDFERNYWASFRAQLAFTPLSEAGAGSGTGIASNNRWLQNGIELHWNAWSQNAGSSQLLDTTPGSPRGKEDAALVIGRTFSDASANVHITPVAKGGTDIDPWIDVVVNVGPFPSNLPPTLAINANSNNVPTNAVVTFTASATDPNGDAVAYYWDFGDETFGVNSNRVSKSWSTNGDYVVRCEVTDLKGGVTSSHLVITVGSPGTFRISGRVIDNVGNPLAGVRVHNGMAGTNSPYSADYRWAVTDSQGKYTMVNLVPGAYTNAAFLYGYKIIPLNFFNPVSLVDADAAGINYLATPLPHLSVTTNGPASEATSNSGTFTLTRTGSTNLPQVVLFQISGTATLGADYKLPANSVTLTNVTINEAFGTLSDNVQKFNFVTIPPGAYSTNITVNPTNDAIYEGTETVTLTLELPLQSLGFLTDTNITNSVYSPGWEVLPAENQPTWFQSYPDYVLADGRAEATLQILDDDPATKPTVSIFAVDTTATESGHDLGLLTIVRFGSVTTPLTVFLTAGGTATSGNDYVPLPSSVTIPAGASFVNLSVIAIDDLYVESSETVLVTLAANPAYSVGAASATVTIVDNDLPTVSISATAATAAEPGINPAAVVVTRVGDLTSDLNVNYLVSGTATSGRDFATLPGSVTIPAGRNEATITVTPLDDRSIEGDETVLILISDSPTYNIGSPFSATVVIQDNELPTVSIQAPTNSVAGEPNNPAAFTVTRTGSVATDLNVFFTTSGTAIHQADYAAIGDRVKIPAGANSATITITPIDDPYRESTETVIITLLSGPSYNLSPQYQASTTIDDNDSGVPAVGFTVPASSGPESVPAPVIAVAVSAEPADQTPVTVYYGPSGGTAVANVDYKFSGDGSLTFTNGGPTIQNISLMILNNTNAQPDRTIIISLFSPSVDRTVVSTNIMPDPNDPTMMVTNISTNTVSIPSPTNAYLDVFRVHTYTILDDDLATVTIRATDPDARELGAKPGLFTVSRVGSTNRDLTVYFQVTGTASSGTDFIPIGNSVVIPAGTNAVNIPLIPVDDPVQESPETVTVTLISSPGAQIGASDQATVIITDNNGALEFTDPVYQVNENAGLASITVHRTGDATAAVTVDYATSDGTATAGLDYVRTNGTLNFGPGDTVKTIVVSIINDSLVEPAETINLRLTNPTGGAPLGGQNSAVLKILDDDTGFEFASATFNVNENGTNAVVSVNRTGIATNVVTVDYATTDGTAVAGMDYTNSSGTLTFAAGETNKTFTVPIIDDILVEGDETITLTLSNPTGGASLDAQSTATLVITDDECNLEFEFADYSVNEYAGTVTVNVRRVGGTVNPVSVDYATRDGSATNGLDYVSQRGTLNFRGDAFVVSTNGGGTIEFQPGESNRVVTITILDDVIGERNEFFNVTLSNVRGPAKGALPGSAILGGITNTVVTIIDNETPGNLDYEFDPGLGANDRVRSVALQADGRIVIGGAFTLVDGISLNHIAELHPDGYLDSSFNPGEGADGPVFAVAAQPDGKVLLGGAFGNVDGEPRNFIARLNADGHADLSFDPGTGPDDAVRVIAVQTDGAVIIGGDFTSVSGIGHSYLARLNADGSVDDSFNADADGVVRALAVQPDGKLLIGGDFTSVNGDSRSFVARLNEDGSVDGGFGGSTDNTVHSIAVQADGRVVIGGAFSSVNGGALSGFARLAADGSLDGSFDPGTAADGVVYGVAVEADGKVIVAGEFTAINGSDRIRFARLNVNGSVDATFDPGTGANGTIYSIAGQPDSAVVIGGDFTVVNGINRNRIARVHGDEKFSLGVAEFDSSTYTVAENGGSVAITVRRTGNLKGECSVHYATSDGSAVAGADYVAANGTLNFAAGESEKTFSIQIRDDVLPEGTETFNLTLSNAVGVEISGHTAAVVVIVDDEGAVAFAAARYSVRENDGTVVLEVTRTGSSANVATVDYATSDGSAQAGLDYVGTTNTVSFGIGETNQTITISILDDALVEGDETFAVTLLRASAGLAIGNQSIAQVTIIEDDISPFPGAVDSTFNPKPGGTNVYAIAIQPAGQIVIGGSFTNFNGAGLNYLERLTANGVVDDSFAAGSGPNGIVSTLLCQPDGKIIAGGSFTSINGVNRLRIARLNAGGSLDANFELPLGLDLPATALALQTDGKVLIGGSFTRASASERNHLARLNANGSLDTSFDPGTGTDQPVYAIAVQPDGKVIIGGAFTRVNGVDRSFLARLEPTGTLDKSFNTVEGPNAPVYAATALPDGKIVLGGEFSAFNGATRRRVVRLNANGSLDLEFASPVGVNDTVYALLVATDESVLIGGQFTAVDGVSRNRIARLQANGLLDAIFNPGSGANNSVYALAFQSGGKILIGGQFTQVSGVSLRGIARLHGNQASPLVLDSLVLLGNGQFRFSFPTEPGRTYFVEGSVNLLNWISLQSIPGDGTTTEFTDTNAPSFVQRFYRVRVP